MPFPSLAVQEEAPSDFDSDSDHFSDAASSECDHVEVEGDDALWHGKSLNDIKLCMEHARLEGNDFSGRGDWNSAIPCWKHALKCAEVKLKDEDIEELILVLYLEKLFK